MLITFSRPLFGGYKCDRIHLSFNFVFQVKQLWYCNMADSNVQRHLSEKLDTSETSKINADSERQQDAVKFEEKKSVYAGLGWLDRLLVLWILLAIIIGILLGNFVDGIGPALQRGKFVDVSIPIGEL